MADVVYGDHGVCSSGHAKIRNFKLLELTKKGQKSETEDEQFLNRFRRSALLTIRNKATPCSFFLSWQHDRSGKEWSRIISIRKEINEQHDKGVKWDAPTKQKVWGCNSHQFQQKRIKFKHPRVGGDIALFHKTLWQWDNDPSTLPLFVQPMNLSLRLCNLASGLKCYEKLLSCAATTLDEEWWFGLQMSEIRSDDKNGDGRDLEQKVHGRMEYVI